MKQCGLVKLLPLATSVIDDQETALRLAQRSFDESQTPRGITNIIWYEDKLYYVNARGIVSPIENTIISATAELKKSINEKYRLANSNELELANIIVTKHLPLVDDTIGILKEYLTPKDELNLALASVIPEPSRFFSNRQQTIINRLIEFTLKGNQIKVEELLQRHPEYAAIKGNARDYSNRLFINASAFECALWAWDIRYMCNMMLDCLPYGDNGESTREKLLLQADNLEVTYKLDGQAITEPHFGFQPLIDGLQAYIDNYDTWTFFQRVDHWCGVVGLAQRHLPAIIVQHYCNPNAAYYTTPVCNEPVLTRSLTIHNWSRGQDQSWFSDMSSSSGRGLGMGWSESFESGSSPPRVYGQLALPKDAAIMNLTALTALRKMSLEDQASLMIRLQSHIQKPVDKNGPWGCTVS